MIQKEKLTWIMIMMQIQIHHCFQSEYYSDLYNEVQGRFKFKQCEFTNVTRTQMRYHMILDHKEIR